MGETWLDSSPRDNVLDSTVARKTKHDVEQARFLFLWRAPQIQGRFQKFHEKQTISRFLKGLDRHLLGFDSRSDKIFTRRHNAI